MFGRIGTPKDFRPMRLSEIVDRAKRGDDGYGGLKAARVYMERRKEGICTECGVLRPVGRETVCPACRDYLNGG